MARQFGIALVVALTCAGCASSYETKAENTATVTFQKGVKSGFGVAGAQAYYISDTKRCSDSKLTAEFKERGGGSKSVKVPVDAPIIVSARTEYFYTENVKLKGGDASPTVKDKTCDDALAFSPILGHTYKVTHDAEFRHSCKLEIIDTMTKKAPDTDKVGGKCPPG